MLQACMSYADNDRRLVYRSDGRNVVHASPDSTDKFIYVAIGLKRLNTYAGDPVRAAEVESESVVREFGLCPNGYTLKVIPKARTGDYGFGWTIVCR